MRRKTLQELTIMDGFMFGAVMMEPENCRLLLERILEIPIDRVEVIREKSMIYHPDIDCQDGIHTIILNNRGTNPEEIPKELVSFLEYTRKTIPESEAEVEDDYIRRIQDSIRRIKDSREMGERYMTLQEMLKEEREEGRKEGWKEGLTEGRELERMELMVRLVREEGITEEKGAEILEISVEEFREKLNRHPENRDVD